MQLTDEQLEEMVAAQTNERCRFVAREAVHELKQWRSIAERDHGKPVAAGAETLDPKHLSSAVDALGDIMKALAARRLVNSGIKNAVIRAKLEADQRTDEQLEKLAADAFEAGVMALAEVGYPGVTVHSCNPTEEP